MPPKSNKVKVRGIECFKIFSTVKKPMNDFFPKQIYLPLQRHPEFMLGSWGWTHKLKQTRHFCPTWDRETKEGEERE